jgi:restriction system protein
MPWLYTKHVVLDGGPILGRAGPAHPLCPHCRIRLSELAKVESSSATDGWVRFVTNVSLITCPICGWWLIAVQDRTEYGPGNVIEDYSHLHSVLETCDVSVLDGTADELQRYLLHRYDQRFDVRPHVFEDVVGQVFRNHGYHVEATARSNDGGIDLFVAEKAGVRRAVQVKRYAGKIEAALIREFAGALVLGGATEGIFVTTSSFTAGAIDTVDRYGALQTPYRIELWDAERFYQAMSFRKEEVYSGPTDAKAPFHHEWERVLLKHDHGHGWF